MILHVLLFISIHSKNAEISSKIVVDDVVKSKNSKIKSYVFIEMEIYVCTEITLVDPEHNPSSN